MMIQFSFLFSGKRSPTHPGCHQEFPPHEGHPHEVPDQGLRGHQQLPGRKSGKNILSFLSKITNICLKVYK